VRILFYYRGIENLGVGYIMSMLKHHGHQIDLIFDPGLDDNLFIKAPHLAWLNRHEVLLERARAVQDRARAAGRPPLQITIFSAPYDVARLRELAEVGVVRVVTSLRPTVYEEPDPTRLERFIDIVAEVEQELAAP